MAVGHYQNVFGYNDISSVKNEVAKTSNYTVLAKDAGTRFTNTGASGAVTFTLPTLTVGLAFEFCVVADQTVTIASAAGDDIVAPNDASADSIAFSTGGDKVGACVQVLSNGAGTKWLIRKMCGNAMTVAT